MNDGVTYPKCFKCYLWLGHIWLRNQFENIIKFEYKKNARLSITNYSSPLPHVPQWNTRGDVNDAQTHTHIIVESKNKRRDRNYIYLKKNLKPIRFQLISEIKQKIWPRFFEWTGSFFIFWFFFFWFADLFTMRNENTFILKNQSIV